VRSLGGAVAVLMVAAGLPLLGRAWLGSAAPMSIPLLDEPLPAGPMNFLIAGLDHQPSWPAGRKTRADGIIVAHVPADRSAVFLLTIPRDLEVALPDDRRDKINAAYAYGGFPLLARTVTRLTGVTFDGGATVELAGLARLVDELGGVRFCVERRAISIHTGRTFEPGCRTMTGAEARDFLRQRKVYPDGSAQRAWYLAKFLRALLRQVASGETLASLDRLRAVVGTVRRHVTVDTRGRDPVALAWQLRSATREVLDLSVPVVYSERTGAVRAARAADGLFDALRHDTLDAWVAANPDRGERLDG